MNEYWVLAIITFLLVLVRNKYETIECLRECIEDYLCELDPREVIEGDDVVELDELTNLITDFVISNKELFSKYKVKDEPQR